MRCPLCRSGIETREVITEGRSSSADDRSERLAADELDPVSTPDQERAQRAAVLTTAVDFTAAEDEDEDDEAMSAAMVQQLAREAARQTSATVNWPDTDE